MGISYYVVNATKKQYLYSTGLKQGYKWFEGVSGPLAQLTLFLLMEHTQPGDLSWQGDEVKYVGEWYQAELEESGQFAFIGEMPEVDESFGKVWRNVTKQTREQLLKLCPEMAPRMVWVEREWEKHFTPEGYEKGYHF